MKHTNRNTDGVRILKYGLSTFIPHFLPWLFWLRFSALQLFPFDPLLIVLCFSCYSHVFSPLLELFCFSFFYIFFTWGIFSQTLANLSKLNQRLNIYSSLSKNGSLGFAKPRRFQNRIFLSQGYKPCLKCCQCKDFFAKQQSIVHCL
jgi:hypothetical protein